MDIVIRGSANPYREWWDTQKLTLRQQHNPGERLFVDHAGATIPIQNGEAGEIHQASLFVAAMGFSSYTFAEATWSQELPCWRGMSEGTGPLRLKHPSGFFAAGSEVRDAIGLLSDGGFKLFVYVCLHPDFGILIWPSSAV